MSFSNEYRVVHQDGVRLVYGSVPLSDMVALLGSGEEGDVCDAHLASFVGATLAMGSKEDVKALMESENLPISAERQADYKAAKQAGLPDTFAMWLLKGNRGTSSNYLAHTIVGIPARAERAVPRDQSDFRRCIAVVEALTGHTDEQTIVDTMSRAWGDWGRIAKNWSEMKTSGFSPDR